MAADMASERKPSMVKLPGREEMLMLPDRESVLKFEFFRDFAKEEENFSRRRDELAATKAEVQDTLAMLDHQKAEQIWYTYRQLCRNYATVCR